jgi:light-regulated signal transduction histidine kinase (bacteriophytochrome)
LIVVDAGGRITHASANLSSILGAKAEEVLDRPLREVLGWSHEEAPSAFAGIGDRYDVTVRPTGSLFAIEFEPEAGTPIGNTLSLVRGFDAYPALRDFSEVLAQRVRTLCGFDRVMIYKFLPDESGLVIAEAAGDAIEPYLGLRYPATDIPQQARSLYLRNRSRLIADVGYEPVPILASGSSEVASEPLDMSDCALRSVSPVHVQYLKNMQVAASMSISLVHGGRLWGLIACHHYQPWYGSKAIREVCETIGEVASIHIGAIEERNEANSLRRGQTPLRSIARRILDTGYFLDGLRASENELLDLVRASGLALIRDGEVHLIGATPSTTEVMRLSKWVAGQFREPVFQTDRLAEHVPEARRYAPVASGLLAAPLHATAEDQILWFRPEVIQTVTWAGRPDKEVDGAGGIGPRRSFEAYCEEVRQRSTPWEPTRRP